MRLACAIAQQIAESIRESLPASEETAGVWLSGFVYAMVLHWVMLVLTTWAYFR